MRQWAGAAVVAVGLMVGAAGCSETAATPRAQSYCAAARDLVESMIVTDGTSVRMPESRGCSIDTADGSDQYVGMMDTTADELVQSLAQADLAEVPTDSGYVLLSTAPFEYAVEVGECRLVVFVGLDDSRPPTLDGPNQAFVVALRDGLRSGAIRCSRED
ncbi:MAG: hypothetical protein ABMA25_13210 [Ilumatobacteraceae bacterium]